MTLTSLENLRSSSTQYSDRVLKRAEIALFCSPFLLKLFVAMRDRSVPIPIIANAMGLQQNYTKKMLSENKAESELVWLISVGILRREVDGQGLTDSFRLTPLGRQIIAKWFARSGNFPPPTFIQRINNTLNRWWKF
jgi:hypothetical protein